MREGCKIFQRRESKEASATLFFHEVSLRSFLLPPLRTTSPFSFFKQNTMAQQAEKGTFAVKVRGIGLVCFRTERERARERDRRKKLATDEREKQPSMMDLSLAAFSPFRRSSILSKLAPSPC